MRCWRRDVARASLAVAAFAQWPLRELVQSLFARGQRPGPDPLRALHRGGDHRRHAHGAHLRWMRRGAPILASPRASRAAPPAVRWRCGRSSSSDVAPRCGNRCCSWSASPTRSIPAISCRRRALMAALVLAQAISTPPRGEYGAGGRWMLARGGRVMLARARLVDRAHSRSRALRPRRRGGALPGASARHCRAPAWACWRTTCCRRRPSTC